MKPILNYFVPFTNGKFIASCLMHSSSVYGSPNQLNSKTDWTLNEYSDVDVWWKDHEHNWFNTDNWIDYVNAQIPTDQYVFYTCHENYAVDHIKRIIPASRIICVIPNLELCKKNYAKKNWILEESDFDSSRVYKEFHQFNPIVTDLAVLQSDLFQVDTFVKLINYLCQGLDIKLDMDQVLEYRSRYFSHPMNQL